MSVAKCTKTMKIYNVIAFQAGKEYVWEWPTDDMEKEWPTAYAVFNSEISPEHIMGYENTMCYFT